MTFLVRQAFAKQFNSTPDDLDMKVVYDVSHNIAKTEEHLVDGKMKTLLECTGKELPERFPPHHPLIPVDYQFTGQPVLIGGTMGTCSYVLAGTDKGMRQTFGSSATAPVGPSLGTKLVELWRMKMSSQTSTRRGLIRIASPKLRHGGSGGLRRRHERRRRATTRASRTKWSSCGRSP